MATETTHAATTMMGRDRALWLRRAKTRVQDDAEDHQRQVRPELDVVKGVGQPMVERVRCDLLTARGSCRSGVVTTTPSEPNDGEDRA